MFHRERVERDYARLYSDLGLGTTIWSPLCSGILTGKNNDGIPDDSRMALAHCAWLRKILEREDGRAQIEKVRQLEPVAKALDCTPAQMALAWCLKNPHVSTVITGASKPEQVAENMQALDVVRRMDERVMAQIDSILQNRPRPLDDWRVM
jgi:aryl-alcohol dehydrogenase-like predicted oxidoreductase